MSSSTDEHMKSTVLLVEALIATGAARCVETTNWALLESDLTSLFTRGLAPAVAEWLGKKLFDAFTCTHIAPFTQAVVADAPLALSQLHRGYKEHVTILRRCGDKLRCKEVENDFAVAVRCAILERDILTGTAPSFRKVFFDFLQDHARKVLAQLESSSGFLSSDTVIAALRNLHFSASGEMKRMWKQFLRLQLSQKLECLDDNFCEPQLEGLQEWKERTIDTFARMVLSSDRDKQPTEVRLEVGQWSHMMDQWLLNDFARKRIASFFNVVVEFPDSMPALQDLQICLSRSEQNEALQKELVQSVRRVLASKLQHAGAQTEDVLVIVVGTIRSLCSIFSKNEAAAVVSSVVSDTIEHLRRRKDSVSAVVRCVMQPSSESLLYGELHGRTKSAQEDDDDTGEEWQRNGRPDVLGILLSALSVGAISQEYRALLSHDLLDKTDYNVDAEVEALERMNCIFGEEALASCSVMVRDVQESRRLNTRIHQNQTIVANALMVSATCWPALPSEKYKVHQKLNGYMESYLEGFRKLKPNQRLVYLNDYGKVTISLDQADPQTKLVSRHSFELPLFLASIVMHLVDQCPDTIDAIAAKMETTSQIIKQRIQPHVPTLLVVGPNGQLSLQKQVVTGLAFTFSEVEGVASPGGGLSKEEMAMYSNMIFAMLKTGGKKTLEQIENSMKMFGKFQGTSAQVRSILDYYVQEGKLTIDGPSFAIVKT